MQLIAKGLEARRQAAEEHLGAPSRVEVQTGWRSRILDSLGRPSEQAAEPEQEAPAGWRERFRDTFARGPEGDYADRDAELPWRARLLDRFGARTTEGATGAETSCEDGPVAWEPLRGLRETISRAVDGGPVATQVESGSSSASSTANTTDQTWKAQLKGSWARAVESVQQTIQGSDLSHQFLQEARSFALVSSDGVVQVLELWEARLSGAAACSAPAGGGRVHTTTSNTESAMAAFLYSNALMTSIEILVSSREHRRALSERAHPDAIGASVGEVVLRLMARVSSVPLMQLDRLLTLLVDAQNLSDCCREEARSEADIASSAETFWWVRMLLAASLTDWHESELMRDASLTKAVAFALSDDGDGVDENLDHLQQCATTGVASDNNLLIRAETCSSHCREMKALLASYLARRAARPVQPSLPKDFFEDGDFSKEPLLNGVADTLRALRENCSQHALSLDEPLMNCAHAEEGCQSQLRQGLEGFRDELSGLQKQQAETTEEIQELKKARWELKCELERVEEKIAAAEARSEVLNSNEERIQENMKCHSEELCTRLSTEGTRQAALVEERHMIQGAREIAGIVEDSLAARASATAAAARELEAAGDVGVSVAAAYALSGQGLINVLEALWAKCGKDLKDPKLAEEQLAALRPTLEQAGSLAEQALLEASKLSAECTGFQGMASMLQGVEEQAKKLAAQFRGATSQLDARLARTSSDNLKRTGPTPSAGCCAPEPYRSTGYSSGSDSVPTRAAAAAAAAECASGSGGVPVSTAAATAARSPAVTLAPGEPAAPALVYEPMLTEQVSVARQGKQPAALIVSPSTPAAAESHAQARGPASTLSASSSVLASVTSQVAHSLMPGVPVGGAGSDDEDSLGDDRE